MPYKPWFAANCDVRCARKFSTTDTPSLARVALVDIFRRTIDLSKAFWRCEQTLIKMKAVGAALLINTHGRFRFTKGLPPTATFMTEIIQRQRGTKARLHRSRISKLYKRFK